ncbi:protein PFC0760c-like isoform X2 [Plodia interpunctella]|uniref:protein PFC0760c-like isoform X2 n=1 Tax=Plodia interpunctella TaxID=58824 RepID=UPI0023675DAD|nr:protein PFC0760c-like isoform X2 [Plodia interpunctella]
MKSVYFVIAVFCVVPCAFQDVWDEYDTWYDDMDDFKQLENEELVGRLDESEDRNLPDTQNKDENKDDYYANENDNDYGDYEIEDNRDEVKPKMDDQEKNKEQELEKNDESAAIEDFDTLQKIMNNDEDSIDEDVIDKILAVDEKSQIDLNVLIPEDVNNEEMVNEEIDIKGIQQMIDDINQETQQILENVNSQFDEDNVDVKNEPNDNIQEKNQDIIKETRQILEETNKEFDENKEENQAVVESKILGDNNDNEEAVVLEDKVNKDTRIHSNEDTVDKVYEDLNADLDKLFETWKKLSVDDDESDINAENVESAENKNEQVIQDNVNVDDSKAINEANIDALPDIQADIQNIIKETQQILEDTNKEFDENNEDNQEVVEEPDQDGVILNVQNEDPKQILDNADELYDDTIPNLEKLVETWKQLSPNNENGENSNVENKNEQPIPKEANGDDDYNRDKADIGDDVKDENFDYEAEARILQSRQDYYDSIPDKDLASIFEDNDNELHMADTDSEESVPVLYVNDALVAESNENNQKDNESLEENKGSVDVVENDDELKMDDVPKDENDTLINSETQQNVEEKSAKLTKDVDELNSDELAELNRQFTILHSADLKNDADETPIYITLNAHEPVVITSPNYPDAYPTDTSIIDWVLEGPGIGLEVNVTDLEINSVMGHYLLLKPGQSDASGDDGIVFAYRLNNERRYRFRDVNKMLVRFNPVGGMSFAKGFRLSAKIIAPVSAEDDDDLSEPDTLPPEPRESATLLLAGANTTTFEDIREEFRRLLADMATMYINSNDIDPGMNETVVVAQITRTYVCNINWPDFDSCVSVTFGIPLVYEEDTNRLTERELIEMWENFSGRDPFAARLTSMGISDYTPPRDSYILTLWVVIGTAVFIAAAVLSFVLWRYSCVENYTRMVDYNDTDSFQEKKRALDMYPTPHQTLPPLYSESDYKWADRTFDDDTKVDMGGFTNNTFTRDEMSDESEDEAGKRDRNSFKPREFSAV